MSSLAFRPVCKFEKTGRAARMAGPRPAVPGLLRGGAHWRVQPDDRRRHARGETGVPRHPGPSTRRDGWRAGASRRCKGLGHPVPRPRLPSSASVAEHLAPPRFPGGHSAYRSEYAPPARSTFSTPTKASSDPLGAWEARGCITAWEAHGCMVPERPMVPLGGPCCLVGSWLHYRKL